jgi:alkylation response protein AidB-like acyl-CoA dehydrogenase
MGIAAPPAETAWLLHHVLGFDAMAESDTAAILEEATRTAERLFEPLNRDGDRIGSRLVDGEVVPPPGFAEAYRAYAEAGWVGIAASPAHGGQGLPHALAIAVAEPAASANLALSLCPMLTQDAIALLQTHGTDDQQARLMFPMTEGRWSGTMCLTEPQAGSDLAGVRTRAAPDGEFYHVTGQKIFITWGEHGMTQNILHMVLARLPDAPAGSAGISLFAVPKFLADGTRNGVRCLSLEEKLGIHASPTCVMEFAGARGELVGAPHRGLACMFAMMNAARLGVAMEGVAMAERAFRRAADFAAQRVQGGATIDRHPDVRRMLWTMRALALGGRLLTLHAALHADAARGALLIPVAKAWSTDAGVEAASLGVQVHGGMGFIEETGAAQHLRDARITPIYEGTNGIQALTLLHRGLLRDQGAAATALFDEIEAEAFIPHPLRRAAEAARAAADTLRHADTRAADAGASPFLQVIGTLTAGWLCARVARHEAAPPAARAAAQVFLDQILPRIHAHAAALTVATPALVGADPIA